MSMRSFYGRSRSGQRAVCSTTAVRSQYYSVIAAMGVDCVFHFQVNSGSVNGDTFAAYSQELVNYIRGCSSQPAYVKMDNASIHKVERVRQIFSSPGTEVNLLYLPPYTPQLNPIEHLFAQRKGKVRHSAPTNEEISQENCRQYYYKMESNIFLNIGWTIFR